MRPILLARHGETAWNAAGRLQGHTDIELNDAGRAQARALAGLFAHADIATVITSDLLRARETGAIVAEVLGLAAPTIEPELRERRFGIFEGLTRDECASQHPEAWRNWLARTDAPPGGEPIPDAVARIGKALGRIAASPDAGRTLVVSHGGVMRLWLVSVIGSPIPLLANGATYLVEHGEPITARLWT